MFIVRALLAGDEFDLADLASLFPSGDPSITKDDEGYWMSSARLDSPDAPDDATAIDHAASELLVHVNGAARVVASDYRPVNLVHRFAVEGPDGTRRDIIVQAETIIVRGRAHVVAIGGSPSAIGGAIALQPNKSALSAMHLAQTHAEVAEALELMAGDLEWVTLYKVYEIVRHSVGSQQALERRGYASRAQKSAFTASADRPDVSGREARHARMKGGRPRRTMTPPEGREFVRELVARWLRGLDAEAPPTSAT